MIDATAGNGHDTEFLASLVGETGRVVAFDVQRTALDSTRARLTAQGWSGRAILIHGSHAELPAHVDGNSASAIVFNLGYLPGADQSIITTTAETLRALDGASHVLRNNGLLAVVCYPGHAGGDEETEAVEAWMQRKAAERWRISRHSMIGTVRPSPCFFAAEKPAV